jgi:thiol-disulfide isomerase/thioredoxin
MSRRTVFSLVLLLLTVLLAGAWFLVTGLIRAHVDDLIQHSVGKPMPDFSLADRAGRVWTAADLKGKRAVLHFFRSRCHSCDVEAPAVLELEARLPEDTVLLHVMTDAVLDLPGRADGGDDREEELPAAGAPGRCEVRRRVPHGEVVERDAGDLRRRCGRRDPVRAPRRADARGVEEALAAAR